MRSCTPQTLRRRAAGVSALVICALIPLWTGCDVFCRLFGLPEEFCQGLGPYGSRPIQSLGVTLDVRFIGVEDDFFDRIGADFNYNFDSDAPLQSINGAGPTPPSMQPDSAFLAPSTAVGGQENTFMFVPRLLDSLTYFLPTVPQNENSKKVNYFPGVPIIVDLPVLGIFAQPGLGNLTGGAVLNSNVDVDAASFGFSILSDIEAFFFLQAAQNDSRNNILSAPKLMLSHGQSAAVIGENEPTTINDVLPPFVQEIQNVNPGAQSVFSGPSLTVTPTISSDRRYVVLTLSPIRALQTRIDGQAQANGVDYSLLFPVIEPSTVQSMVAVPDGGTVLLGGIKRMSDGQIERGVPILNNLPYLNRLFKNDATIKENQVLLLMVTPRIIIQEE